MWESSVLPLSWLGGDERAKVTTLHGVLSATVCPNGTSRMAPAGPMFHFFSLIASTVFVDHTTFRREISPSMLGKGVS